MLSTVSASPLSEKEIQNLSLFGVITEVEREPLARSADSGNESKWLYSINQYENIDFKQNFQVEIITSPMLDHQQFRSRLLVAARGTDLSEDDSLRNPSASGEASITFTEYQDDMQVEEEMVYLQLRPLNDETSLPAREIQFFFDLSNFMEEAEMQTTPTAIPREEFKITPDEGEDMPVLRVGYVFERCCKSMNVVVKTIKTQPPGSSVGARLQWPDGSKPPKENDKYVTSPVMPELSLDHNNFDGKNIMHRLYIETSGKPIFTFGGTYLI